MNPWKVIPAEQDGVQVSLLNSIITSLSFSYSYCQLTNTHTYRSCVGRVEWNITGTVLSSSGNDAKIRLWKASEGGSIWKFAGSVGVEQKEDEDENSSANSKRNDGDVNMAG